MSTDFLQPIARFAPVPRFKFLVQVFFTTRSSRQECDSLEDTENTEKTKKSEAIPFTEAD